MSAPSLVLRPDGQPGVGAGHLSRCLALAQAWRDAHGEAAVIGPLPPAWLDRFRAEGVAHEPGWEGITGDWTITDGYDLGREERLLARDAAPNLLVIDDHGIAGGQGADLLLDQNLGANAGSYPELPRHDLLLGPRYALLRREFATRDQANEPPASGPVLLASGGGGATTADVLLEAIARAAGIPEKQTVWLRGVEDVAEVMQSCSLAISAAGSTAWELCCVGVPATLLALTPNQVPVARELAARGVSLDLTRLASSPAEAGQLVRRLREDVTTAAAMALAARRLVDGFGSKRVSARMRASLLHVRPVAPTDCRLLFDWANDPQVRAQSFTPESIEWDRHVDWFEAKLADAACKIFIAERPAGVPIGQVRFDIEASTAEIDWSIARAERGHGWGPALLVAALQQLGRDTRVDTALAKVRTANLASRRSFVAADFDADSTDHGPSAGDWVLYRRRLHDSQ